MNSTSSTPVAFQSVMLDLDGTLIDTLPDFDVAINAMLRELALPAVDAATLSDMIGRGSEQLIRSVLAHVGAPLSLYQAAWDSYWHRYLAINGQHARVYPGVREGIAALRDMGMKLACLTNKPGDFARPLLDRAGLSDSFEFVFAGEAFERKKPDPLPLQRTCEALGGTPSCTLMIGDSSNDARAARAAGCAVVLVTYGYNHGEPVRSVDADAFVDSIAQVPAWITQRTSQAARP